MFKTALHMRVKDKDKEIHNESVLFSFIPQRNTAKKKASISSMIGFGVGAKHAVTAKGPAN